MNISKEIFNLLIFVLTYFSLISGLIYIAFFVLKLKFQDKIKITFISMHIAYIISVILNATLSTFLQYQAWLSNSFTKILTTLPLKDGVPMPGILSLFRPLFQTTHGYFSHYSIVHFWLTIIWSMIAAFIFMAVIVIARKKRPHLLNTFEVNFIFAASIVVGWPNIIGFILIMFSLFVIHSIITYLMGGNRTIILPSAICSLSIIFIFQNIFHVFVPYINQLNFIVK